MQKKGNKQYHREESDWLVAQKKKKVDYEGQARNRLSFIRVLNKELF